MRRYALALPLALSLTACISVPAGFLPLSQPPAAQTTTTTTTTVATGSLRYTGGVLKLETAQAKALAPLLQDAAGQPVTAPLTWSSTAKGVVSVDDNGLVKAVGRGSATIVVSLLTQPSVRAEIPVEVGTNRSSIAVRVTPDSPTLAVGERVTLRGEVTLADGQIKADIAWTSSDNTIAVVNGTTGEVNALKPGRVTIVGAYASDPTYSARADVTVVADASDRPTPAPSAVIFRPGAGAGSESFDGSDGWTRDNFKEDTSVNAFDMADPQTGIAVGPQGRVYATLDGGVTWDFLAAPALRGLDLMDVALPDAQNGYAVARTNKVYATHDGGATWQSLSALNDSDGNPVSLTQVAFADAKLGYAAGFGAVFKTTDGGATWGRVEISPDVRPEAMALGGSKLFLIGGQNVYAYAAGKWTSHTLLTSPNMLDATFKRHMVSYASATKGWVTGAMGGFSVSRSTDGGQSFDTVEVKPASGAEPFKHSGGTLTTIAFTDADAGVLTIGDTAYATRDGGKTWLQKPLGHYTVIQTQAVGARDFYMLARVNAGAPAGTPFATLFHFDGR